MAISILIRMVIGDMEHAKEQVAEESAVVTRVVSWFSNGWIRTSSLSPSVYREKNIVMNVEPILLKKKTKEMN